jgi:hypothetical protein
MFRTALGGLVACLVLIASVATWLVVNRQGGGAATSDNGAANGSGPWTAAFGNCSDGGRLLFYDLRGWDVFPTDVAPPDAHQVTVYSSLEDIP